MKLYRFVGRLGSPGRVDLVGSQAHRGWPWHQVNKNAQEARSQKPQNEANRKITTSRYGDWTYGKFLVFGSERTNPIPGEIDWRRRETHLTSAWVAPGDPLERKFVNRRLKVQNRSQPESRWISKIGLGLWTNFDPDVEENEANSVRVGVELSGLHTLY